MAAAAQPTYQHLPCTVCVPTDPDIILYAVNNVCRGQSAALLCCGAKMCIKSSPNQLSRAFWTLDFIRAYECRTRLKAEDNCKLSQSLRTLFTGAFSGGSLAKDSKGATHMITNAYEMMQQRPATFQPLFHKRIPTTDGWVFLQPVPEATVFQLLVDRAYCSICQDQV